MFPDCCARSWLPAVTLNGWTKQREGLSCSGDPQHKSAWKYTGILLSSSVGDPYLWLMHLDPDPTPFFIDFMVAKNIIFFIIFSYNLPTGTLSSVFLLIFCVEILFCKHYFSPLNTIYEKREGSGSGSVPLFQVFSLWVLIVSLVYKSINITNSYVT